MGQICVSWHFLRKVPRVKLPVYKASGQLLVSKNRILANH
ncbi:hypothetical protein VCHA36P161_100185 [Vibrio chagasii]|nr:hypothetical protein VCHA36P161_100185 [Vibrio chagasii]CAH7080611.1 hypothetical protein VCHA34P129_90016 [Vibrio chagasii]CAH7417646.1 hypothetical protein VCHA52P455_90017 [Vibrio chagasii]CAH7433638.1 hypothetical protein VCHA48P442_90018 [Vibrio chagasii]